MADGDVEIRRDRGAGRRLRVAALIVVGLGCIAFGTYEVGRVFDVFSRRYELVTLLPSAAGLRQGAPVSLAGQRVGQVSGIDFVPLGTHHDSVHVAVHMAVDTRVRGQIRRDSRAFIRSQGLLGDKYVDISPGSPGAPELAPGDTLLSTEVVDLDNVLATAASTMRQAEAVINDARIITSRLVAGKGTAGKLLEDDTLYRQMAGATAQLASLLREVNAGKGDLGHLVRDSTLYQQTVLTVTHLDSLTSSLLAGRGTLGKLLTSDSLYTRALGSVTVLDSTLSATNRLLGQVESGQGSLSRLIADPALYDQLLKAVVDMQTLIRDIRQHPEKYRPEIHIF